MNYRSISPSFWTDPKVDDCFTPEDKYFYLYLLTNPHATLCGCYEIGMKSMERETGYNSDTLTRLINRMEHEHKVIKYCPDTKEVLLLNWSKYNWSRSEKLATAIRRVSAYIKTDEFRDYVLTALDKKIGITQDTGNRTQETGHRKQDTGNRTQETGNSYQETGNTLQDVSIGYQYSIDRVSSEDIENYIKEKNYSIDPVFFYKYYASRNWEIKPGIKMTDWKAALDVWHMNEVKKKNEHRTASARDFNNFEQRSYDYDEIEKQLLRSGL